MQLICDFKFFFYICFPAKVNSILSRLTKISFFQLCDKFFQGCIHISAGGPLLPPGSWLLCLPGLGQYSRSDAPHLTILHCNALYWIALHCHKLYCTSMHCHTLYCTVMYCTTLVTVVLHCTVKGCSHIMFGHNSDLHIFFF